MRKVSLLLMSFVFVLAGVVFAAEASAHVTVKPNEALAGNFQTFNVSVPNEKAIPTVNIKLLIPDGVGYVTPTQKTGWKIDVEKDGSGEDAKVKSITWSGGAIEEGFRDDFSFSAQTPEQPTELQWKAYQTYSDGTVVSWDKASEGNDHESEDENSGPFSVTKVTSETADAAEIKQIQSNVDELKTTSDRALYAAIAGVVLGLLATAIAIIRTR